jgi:hypothetical protein
MAIGNDPNLRANTSIQVGQAVNGGVLDGLLDSRPGSTNGGSATGNAMAAQWGQMQSMNDRAQTGLATQAANAQHFSNAQAKRSESAVNWANNQSQIYGDYNDRRRSQIDLAADITANNIGFAAGLAQKMKRRQQS